MKKPSKRKAGDMVLVYWLDQSYYTGPVEKDTPSLQEAVGKTLGYFVEENDVWLCVAMERFETDRVSYRHIVTFPKVAVVKIAEVREVLPKRRGAR